MKYPIKIYVKYWFYRVKFWVHHFECGKHSGFRSCCISWYCFVLAPMIALTNPMKKQNNWLVKWNLFKDRGAGYRECPACILLKRKPITIKSCDRYCGRNII